LCFIIVYGLLALWVLAILLGIVVSIWLFRGGRKNASQATSPRRVIAWIVAGITTLLTMGFIYVLVATTLAMSEVNNNLTF
jgi:predicted exporter